MVGEARSVQIISRIIITAGGSCGESVCSVKEETGGGAREQMTPSADLLNANALLSALYVYKLVLKEGGRHGFRG